MNISIKIDNLEAVTCDYLSHNNPNIPLPGSDWVDWVDPPIEYLLDYLTAIGSPHAVIRKKCADADEWVHTYEYCLDSRVTRSIDKFNAAICATLGLPYKPRNKYEPLEYSVPQTKYEAQTLGNSPILVTIDYWYSDGDGFIYKARLRQVDPISLDISITVRGLRKLKKLLNKLISYTRDINHLAA
jgi:hypothetical protein